MRFLLALAFLGLLATAANAQQAVNLNCQNAAGVYKPASPTNPCPIAGSNSGPAVTTTTPANSSHAAGTSIGGLLTVALVRAAGGSGILTTAIWKSTGASTGVFVLRLWSKSPANTTCTDNVAFAGSDVDDAFLIAAPISLVPAAPAVTTGDTATYATATGLTLSYKNVDTTASTNLYGCAVTVATDTADDNKQVRLSLSGPQD